MMSVHTARGALHREIGTQLGRGGMNSGQIIITWDAAPLPADPNVASDYVAPDMQTMSVSAFIHFVPVKSALSNFTEFEAGDVMVTFDADHLDLQNKRTVSFTLPDGNTYLQQNTGRDPVEFWSIFIGGRPLTKTLLLRLAPEAEVLGQIYHVGVGGRREALFAYNPTTKAFAAIGVASGRAAIDLSVSGQVTISLGDPDAAIALAPVLLATAEGISVPSMATLGVTILRDEPRLEFWVGKARCASLSATRLAALAATATGTAPTAGRVMEFDNPAWLFSITEAGLFAPAVP